jgi:hypothetical protein
MDGRKRDAGGIFENLVVIPHARTLSMWVNDVDIEGVAIFELEQDAPLVVHVD